MRLWLRTNLSTHPFAAPLLLLSVVVAVYYPSLLSDINSIDDPHIIAYFSRLPQLNEILLPGSHYYYRPVAELTYYLDSLLWGMQPRAMHLENVLLHAANATLVFHLARRFFGTLPDSIPNAPIYCSLFFALHPLNVEAVSWIAGRTDPLASLFILTALLFLVRILDGGGWGNGLFVVLFSLLGILTKEIAAVFVPMTVVAALWWPAASPEQSRRNRLVAALSCSAVLLLMIPLFVKLRQVGTGFDRFLIKGINGLTDSMWETLAAFGFYAKKLLIPVPLNFAIDSINPLYKYLGILCGASLLLAARRKKTVTLLYALATIAVLPALFVAVRQVAWTPYAERYMYLPSAFFSMAFIGMVGSIRREMRNGVIALILLLLCVAASVSLKRTTLWQDNLALFSDTVAKSPGFGAAHNELGAALILHGKLDDAAREFDLAERNNKRESMKMMIKSNIMNVMVARGDFIGARNYFYQLFPSKNDASTEFLDLLHKADSIRFNEQTQAGRLLMADDLKETLDILYNKDGNPFWLYRRGQIAILTGARAEAVMLFRRAYKAAPADAHYRAAAARYVQNLGEKK